MARNYAKDGDIVRAGLTRPKEKTRSPIRMSW
jgi:ribosomal protein S17